jgi:TRAP-type C4-dicarboxylate transport system permease small subunit
MPMAVFYAAIPMCGALVALFTIEQMINGWRNGFAVTDVDERRTSL